MAKEKYMKNPVVVAVDGGFYFFGDEVTGPEGYIALRSCAMFGSFGGGQGLPGIVGGCKGATVTLDRFPDNEEEIFNIMKVLFIVKSVDLYSSEGTTIRGGKK